MSQIVSPHDALHRTLQNQLQPDERLLWTDHPQAKKLRISLLSKKGVWFFLFNAIAALLFTASLYWKISIVLHEQRPLWIFILDFLAMFLLYFIFTLFQMFAAAFREAPLHWHYTLYAITNQRAIIIVRLPACEPSVLSYLPGDIDPVPGLIRRDGSGILLFSEPREARIGRAGPTFELPGSFMGIAHVQKVAALLQQLKAKNELLAQDSTEQLQQ